MKWQKESTTPQVHLEVKANKSAQKSAVKDAKAANKHLIKLIRDENHFTLYLAVATGAELKPKGA